jgi:hypothetical protein
MFRVQPAKQIPEHESGPRRRTSGIVDATVMCLHDGIDPEPVDSPVEPEPNRFIVNRLSTFLVLPVLRGDRRGEKSKRKTVCQPGESYIIQPTSLNLVDGIESLTKSACVLSNR